MDDLEEYETRDFMGVNIGNTVALLGIWLVFHFLRNLVCYSPQDVAFVFALSVTAR